jgi:hypothetical protein
MEEMISVRLGILSKNQTALSSPTVLFNYSRDVVFFCKSGSICYKTLQTLSKNVPKLSIRVMGKMALLRLWDGGDD